MKITDIIRKEDLKEPYDRLSEFLSLDEIIRLEQEFGGRQIKFRKGCTDIRFEYPTLVMLLGELKAAMVVRILSGMWVYFPKLKRSCAEQIKGLIISEFNGYNYLELARKYGYTDRHIRNIIDGKCTKSRIPENQITLFDDDCEMFNPISIM